MRIAADHSSSSTLNARGRVASQQTDKGFADTLTSAVEASASETDTHPPEFSAATYRLFAAIDLEQGDTKNAARHLSRVADAREPGLPLHPSGVLSELGRWDYTEAAAALPETGRFDSATGQGEPTFIPYNDWVEKPKTDGSAPTETAAVDSITADAPTPASDDSVDRLRGRLAALGESPRGERATRIELRAGFEALLDTLPS